jgi:phage shock protein A
VRISEAATGIGDQMADTGLAIQRAKDKTEQMQARASAVEELIESGTLEEITMGDKSQLDRELEQIQASNQVDRELERLKAEVGAGDSQKQLDA